MLIFGLNDVIIAQNTLRDRAGAVDSVKNSMLDSIKLVQDSLKIGTDSLISTQDDVDTMLGDTASFPTASDEVDKIIEYDARDSIIYDIENEMIYLYGEAHVTYDNIKMEAGVIYFSYTKKSVIAEAIENEDGTLSERPVLTESGKTYEGDRMVYNFETKKGKISQLLTTDDDQGFVRGAEVMKNENDELFAKEAYYTTCELDHPHFRIDVDKVKIIPDKLVVSGPANLVIADVPTPLVLPFGIFPLNQRRASGIKLPAYGESPNLGFFLQNGGYYWAINDYIDLAIMGDIYTSGSWRANIASRYRLRYRYSGNIGITYGRFFENDKITPDFSETNQFSIRWSHSQDNKARPNSRFSSSVNIASSNYDRNFGTNAQRVLNNTLNSNVTYNYNFPRAPFSLTISARHSQNVNTHQFDLTVPEVALNMRTLYPFEKRNRVGSKKWYENISVGYNMNTKNELSTLDTLLFEKSTYNNFEYAAQHRIPISTSLKLFKYFNFTPTFNYTERWYFESLNRVEVLDSIAPGSDDPMDYIRTDTIQGFRSVRDFNMGAALTTNLYGIYNFKKGKLKALRHVITPSLSLNYRPDFGTENWDYYQASPVDTSDVAYNRFDGFLYGNAPKGRLGSIGFSIINRLDAKINTPKDTLKKEKKLEILRNLNISTSYNLAVDSFNLAPINITASTNFLNRFNVVFSSSLDPYVFDEALNRRVEIYEFAENRRIGRFTNARLTVGTRFNSDDFTGYQSDRGSDGEIWELNEYPERFLDFNKKWSASLDYVLSLKRINLEGEDSLGVGQTINSSFDVNLTDKWKINGRTGFNVQTREITNTSVSIARDLHCWQMRFDWVPFGAYRNYSFFIGVKAAVLQDLKLTRRRNWYDY